MRQEFADRVFFLNDRPLTKGPVVYWMSRDQRARDHWGLLYGREKALELGTHLLVVFCLSRTFLSANLRHYDFLLRGLRRTAEDLEKFRVPFLLLVGDPREKIPAFLRKEKAGLLITDFDPLRVKQDWFASVSRSAPCAVHEVDSHNIVPCRMASDKRETAAFTLRPKIRLLLPSFLKPIPRFSPMPGRVVRNRIDVEAVLERLKPDPSVAAVPDFEPGTAAGMRRLRTFVSERLEDYPENHNDPVIKGTSDLSPWLHFGQVSAQTAALNVSRSGASAESKESFLEQLIVRRELADNFCLHAPDYDSFSAFPAWARKTLDNHRTLKRPARYTPRQFEHAETHEPLWNACQTEMVRSGKMHNYMRMYWAKKILEWSDSPESALRTAIRLNDRYSLDGRDPNGYTGIAWAIGGVHDRPWPERPVFGMIRYMSAGGAKGKFDTKLYIRRNS